MSLRVLKIAKNATLQDRGRFGFRHYGVPEAGPFDQHSAEASNFALGNDSCSSVLELHAPGAEFEAVSSCWIAVFGALTDVRIDGNLIPENQNVFQLEGGSRIEISSFRKGARLYLAMEGGFEASKMLGSVCGTHVEPGDVFQSASKIAIVEPELPNLIWDFETPFRIPIVPNGFSDFDFDIVENLVVSHHSDRRGIRLFGNVPTHNGRQNSQPICAGAVQWTPSGELIVIGPDGPTIGGYPLIGTVPSFALSRLGQAVMNDPVHLYPISWEKLDEERQRTLLT